MGDKDPEPLRECWGRRTSAGSLACGAVRGADLVVVEQASRLLATYALLAWRAFGGPKVASWGQGHNVQTQNASQIGERVKGILTRRADWFFAYDEASLPVLTAQGFPAGPRHRRTERGRHRVAAPRAREHDAR